MKLYIYALITEREKITEAYRQDYTVVLQNLEKQCIDEVDVPMQVSELLALDYFFDVKAGLFFPILRQAIGSDGHGHLLLYRIIEKKEDST